MEIEEGEVGEWGEGEGVQDVCTIDPPGGDCAAITLATA